MNTSLRGEPAAHWNLILPQIICYIVVLKVLKLKIERSLVYLMLNFALSLLAFSCITRSSFPAAVLRAGCNKKRAYHEIQGHSRTALS